jgi:predicted RNA-binding protein with TRAM domain
MSAPTRNKTEAHRRRKQQDAREILSVGETRDAVVVDRYDGTPVADIREIVTFLEFGIPVQVGDTVRLKISYVDESWAKAVVLARLD